MKKNSIYLFAVLLLCCFLLASCGAGEQKSPSLGVVESLSYNRFTEPDEEIETSAVPSSTAPFTETTLPVNRVSSESSELLPDEDIPERTTPSSGAASHMDPDQVQIRTDIPEHPAVQNPIYLDEGIYQVVDHGNAETGIPGRITQDMVGQAVTFLDKNFTPCEDSTGRKLCEYGPYPSRSFYILQEDGKLYPLVLQEFYRSSAEYAVPLFQLYEYYGVKSPESIVSFTRVTGNGNNTKRAGKPVGGDRCCADFYNESFAMPTVSEAYFYGEIYWDIQDLREGNPKYENRKARIQEDRVQVEVMLESGRWLYLDFYPSYGYMTNRETMTYYQITDEIMAWLSEYILL